MKKKWMWALLAALLVLTAVLSCGCGSEAEPTEPAVSTWKVTFYESDGETVLTEVEVKDGEKVAMPELTKDGYRIEGYYATPALMVPFDPEAPITGDTAVFVAWQSSVEDTRPAAGLSRERLGQDLAPGRLPAAKGGGRIQHLCHRSEPL